MSEEPRPHGEHTRQLIRENRKRKEQEKLEAMLLKALESGERVEATPEYWTKKKANLEARYGRRAGK
jgi:antitoxin ParD1/3/4